jgi:hypothetical protein
MGPAGKMLEPNLFLVSNACIFCTLFPCDYGLNLVFSVVYKPSCYMRMDGRTDGHELANSRFSQFCKRA